MLTVGGTKKQTDLGKTCRKVKRESDPGKMSQTDHHVATARIGTTRNNPM
jgi:hypothetical protein